MRLLNLSIVNFRGFGVERVDITLSPDLVLFYGPNGHGKTSLAEAVEWLFYGTTKRRLRGEEFSRAEYAGTYRNIHNGRPVEVSARILLADGNEHVLTRRLSDVNETSKTLVNGINGEFSQIGIVVSDAVYPVVAQHSLQSFIHSKPKERRDAMSEALGLQELAALKTTLDGARRSFQMSPPTSVAEARGAISGYATGLALKNDFQNLSRRWKQPTPLVLLPADLLLLVQHAQQLTDSASTDILELLSRLRQRRAAAAKSVFNTERLAPVATVTTLQDVATKNGSVEKDAFSSFSRSSTSLLGIGLTTVSRELLSFWQAGIALPTDGDICPMCEQPTLDKDQRDRLVRRLASDEAFLNAHKDFKEKLRLLKNANDSLCLSILECRIGELQATQVQLLKRIMIGLEANVETFLTKHLALIEAFRSFDTMKAAFERSAAILLDRSMEPDSLASSIDDLSNHRDLLIETGKSCIAAFLDYAPYWTAIERDLAGRIGNTEAITFIDAVGKSIKNRHLLQRLVRYDEILSKSKTLMQIAEATLQRKQDEILSVRGTEVSGIYNKLNPGADVGFESMEPGTGNIKLYAKSFGRRMSAAANLSQCQLNCLGLAVWLMQATTSTSPFGFIMLDDPVQSMDDDHCEAFISALVPFLMTDHNKQILILSHLRPIIERVRNLNANLDFRLYHFESYGIQGPTLVEQSEFAKRLAEIKGLADGNEDNRILAVDRLRVLVEKFIRAAHLKRNGVPAPSEFDQAQPSQLLKLFLKIPGTTQQEYAGLDDTVDFSDPAHHSDAGYTPPQKGNIQPHIDRMTNLIKKFDLK